MSAFIPIRPVLSRLILALFVGIVASAALLAQTGSQGTFVGTVTDSTGAVVPGAKVTVVNTETQFTSETTTSAEGNYYVPYLNSGMYRITIAATGFKQYVRDGIELRPGVTPRVNVTLEVGAIADSVTVTGETPLLSTESATTATPSSISQKTSRCTFRTCFTPATFKN